MPEGDMDQRLEILENGLNEVKDLYLSIKLEFMELKKSSGGYIQTRDSKTPQNEASPDVQKLRKQVEILQKNVVNSEDKFKELNNMIASLRGKTPVLSKIKSTQSTDLIKMNREIEALKAQM